MGLRLREPRLMTPSGCRGSSRNPGPALSSNSVVCTFKPDVTHVLVLQARVVTDVVVITALCELFLDEQWRVVRVIEKHGEGAAAVAFGNVSFARSERDILFDTFTNNFKLRTCISLTWAPTPSDTRRCIPLRWWSRRTSRPCRPS